MFFGPRIGSQERLASQAEKAQAGVRDETVAGYGDMRDDLIRFVVAADVQGVLNFVREKNEELEARGEKPIKEPEPDNSNLRTWLKTQRAMHGDGVEEIMGEEPEEKQRAA